MFRVNNVALFYLVMCGVCIYIFNMYTCIPCAYICMIYSYIHAVCSWLSVKWWASVTLDSCRPNLHVAHYGEASSLPGATISYFQFTSALKKGPWGMSLSISLSPGIMGARKTTFEKDGCFHQGWGSWVWMMMGPTPGQKAALGALVLLGLMGEKSSSCRSGASQLASIP